MQEAKDARGDFVGSVDDPNALLEFAGRLETDTVEVANMKVRVRALSAAEKVSLDRGTEALTPAESLEVMIDVIMAGSVKIDGSPLFEPRDAWREKLKTSSETLLVPLFDRIMELSSAGKP